MNKNISIVLLAIAIGAVVAYFYLQRNQPKPEAASIPPAPVVRPLPAPTPTPTPSPVPETKPQPSLPSLADSDSPVLDALSGLIRDESLMKLFNTKHIIHNIVATIDNLPKENVPVKVMPIRPATGLLVVEGPDDNLSLSPKNAARYAPYMKLADAIDAKTLVQLYVRLYPLFQQAYQDLGYPNDSFNDRLLEVLDDLQDAPESRAPLKLVQPHVLYQYADPELEGRPAGQKILMRLGRDNEVKIKAKLGEIKKQVLLQMH